MQDKGFTNDAEILSKLLEFPGYGFYEVLQKCEDQISQSDDPETRYYFGDFIDWIAKNDLSTLRSIYIETFRLDRNVSLCASDYLFDRNLLNQRYFAEQLEHTYRDHNIERTALTSDFIPEIIRFLPLLEDGRQFEIILSNYALYPLLRILERIEESNPYRLLLSFVADMLAVGIGKTQKQIHHSGMVEVA